MDKEEILKRARSEKLDEREMQYLIIGLIMFCVAVMATIRFAMGH